VDVHKGTALAALAAQTHAGRGVGHDITDLHADRIISETRAAPVL